jgi:hypothetical protein
MGDQSRKFESLLRAAFRDGIFYLGKAHAGMIHGRPQFSKPLFAFEADDPAPTLRA